MKCRFGVVTAAVAVLGLAACTSRAQTMQSFSWAGNQKVGGLGGYILTLRLDAVNATTQVNITSALPANGCNTPFVYGYDPASLTGPVLAIGEMVQVTVTNYPAASSIAEITALGGPDPDGYPTFTVAHNGCTSINFGGSTIGTGRAGPGFSPVLHWNASGACDLSQPSVAFTLMQPDGSISQESADAGTVSCTYTENYNTHQLTFTGAFSGTLSTGQAYSGSFTIVAYAYIGSGRDPQSALYARSAAWSITY